MAALFLLSGCASPGVPRPPSLHLPAPVRDLKAARTGNTVRLTFTAPTETTDRLSLTGKRGPAQMTASLCRVEAARCTEFARSPVAPGQAVEAQDTLPPALTLGAARTLLYRVRVENAAGRDGGYSRDALTVAGEAPPALAGLMAATTAQGIRLTWQPAASDAPVRVEAQAEPPAGTKEAQPATRLLHIAQGGTAADPGGAVDEEPAVGSRITYRVYRRRNAVLDGHTVPLDGAAATVSTVRGPDVFPPAAPTGLLAIASFEGSPAGATLSWEPDTEADVVGYRVYRAEAAGPMERLTPTPVRGVSFADSAVHAGAHYRYTVTAVDRSGNESAPSAPVAVDLP